MQQTSRAPTLKNPERFLLLLIQTPGPARATAASQECAGLQLKSLSYLPPILCLDFVRVCNDNIH